MSHIFSLNAEGGPLLCVDAGAAARWNGAEGDAQDYGNLCAVIDAQPEFSATITPIAGLPGVVWEMQGAGTADVFVGDDGRITVVRAWLGEDANDAVEALADTEPVSRMVLGVIDVPSGVLAVFWSVESGRTIPQHIDSRFKQIDGTAVKGSVFVLKAATSRYTCCDELVKMRNSHARRLTLSPS
jgi:hypothetical protein